MKFDSNAFNGSIKMQKSEDRPRYCNRHFSGTRRIPYGNEREGHLLAVITSKTQHDISCCVLFSSRSSILLFFNQLDVAGFYQTYINYSGRTEIPFFLQPNGFQNRTLPFIMSRVNSVHKHKLYFCKVFYNIILTLSVSSVASNVTEDTFTNNRIERQTLSVGQKIQLLALPHAP